MPRLSYLNFVLIVANVIAVAVLAARTDSGPGVEIARRDVPGGVDQMVVQISGAVRDPGVYAVQPGDRVADLVEIAGGFTEEANQGGVNLALRLRDEDRIDVPSIGEEVTATPAAELLDLNAATEDELDELPGIGPAYAGRIIEAREQERFTSAGDLLDREVIPAHVYEGIRLLVTAGP